MPGMLVGTQCQKPTCTKEASDTYRGENGNSLHLCERHYYNLVSGEETTNTITGASMKNPILTHSTSTATTMDDSCVFDDNVNSIGEVKDAAKDYLE